MDLSGQNLSFRGNYLQAFNVSHSRNSISILLIFLTIPNQLWQLVFLIHRRFTQKEVNFGSGFSHFVLPDTELSVFQWISYRELWPCDWQHQEPPWSVPFHQSGLVLELRITESNLQKAGVGLLDSELLHQLDRQSSMVCKIDVANPLLLPSCYAPRTSCAREFYKDHSRLCFGKNRKLCVQLLAPWISTASCGFIFLSNNTITAEC